VPFKGNVKRKLLINIVVAVIYFGIAALTLPNTDSIKTGYAYNQLSISPSITIEIAASILFGPFIWSGVTLAAFAGAMFEGFTITNAIITALAHGIGTLVSGILVHRWTDKKNPFLKIRDFLNYLVIIALLISSGVSAVRALSITLNLENIQSFPIIFSNLWVSAINSLLIVTPFIIAWSTKPVTKTKKNHFRSAIIALILIMALISWTLSGSQANSPGEFQLQSEYIIIPLVILATALFGLRGAVTSSLLYSIFSIAYPAISLSFLSSSNSPLSELFLQSYQAVVACTGLLAAAALSERDKTLQDAIQSHGTQQAFLNNASVWLNTLDKNNNIITWSKGAELISGYSYEEASHNPHFWKNLLPPQVNLGSYQEELYSLIQRETHLQNLEVQIQTKNGEKRLISWNINSLESDKGEILGRIIFGTDITTQRGTEEKLRQERDLAEAVVRAASVINESLEFEEVIQRILSQVMTVIPCDGANIMRLKEGIGVISNRQGYENMENPDIMTAIQLPIQNTKTIIQQIESGSPLLIQNTLEYPDWDFVPGMEWIRSHISVPVKSQGAILGLLNLDSAQPNTFSYAHMRTMQTFSALLGNSLENALRFGDVQTQADIMEQRVTERTAELRSANLELTRALNTKDEFLANMSHELRTPLTAILGMSEMLENQTRGPLNDVQLHYARTIIDSGQHLLALINDILDLAKIESEKLALHIDTILAKDVCDSCLSIIRESAQQKKIDLKFALDQPETTLQADPLRLKQILINLLNNAVKFTPENGSIGLQVCMDEPKQTVQFIIWDTGIGIKSADAQKLFQPFVQLDASLNRHFEGTGLGLTLVAKLAELHGGSIKLESKGIPGKGTRMTVTLPQKQEKQSVSLPTFPIKANVLLIEDQISTIEKIKYVLDTAGLTMRAGKCGREAADLDRSGYPDLVILNMQTCKTNGWNVISQIPVWFSPCNPPIIALSSIDLPGDNERAIAAGASAFMTKPINVEQLSELVKTLLN
jgi:PAS domain S-box-containing protein